MLEFFVVSVVIAFLAGVGVGVGSLVLATRIGSVVAYTHQEYAAVEDKQMIAAGVKVL